MCKRCLQLADAGDAAHFKKNDLIEGPGGFLAVVADVSGTRPGMIFLHGVTTDDCRRYLAEALVGWLG